jgi:DNA-binding transcriptional LysR family regulator
MDKLSAMRAFAKVAESGNFSSAARLLGRSKAVVSKQVAMLEASLGVQLLVRTTRQVRLTEVGRRYQERCAQVLAELDELETNVRQSEASPRGVLRVAGPQTFAELHLSAAMREFLRRFPDLKVELVLTDRIVDLVDNGFDVAIRVGQLEDSSLLARRLASSSIITCAAPEYLARRGVPRTPEQLAAHDLVLDANLRQPGTWRFRRGTRTINVRVSGALQVNSALMVRHFLVSGAGIGLCPEFVVRDDLEAGRLVPLLAQFSGYDLGVYAVYPHTRHVPSRVRVFVDFLADYLAGAP